MPVCALFLRGACTRDDCKYRHVKVSPSAQVCQAFLKGYCADGESCRLKHELPPKKRAALVSGVASQHALDTHGKSGVVPTAKKARVEVDPSGAVDQENAMPSSADEQRAPAASGGVAVESGGLSIRPTIRFRPKHASGFPSLLSVRNSLSN